jgi:hypothetical protein
VNMFSKKKFFTYIAGYIQKMPKALHVKIRSNS